MHTNDVEILCQNENGRIFRCKCCDLYHLQYKNVYLLFTWKELSNFHTIIMNLTEKEFYHQSPVGVQALLKNDAMRMGIALTRDDRAQLDDLYQQALLLKSAITIIRTVDS